MKHPLHTVTLLAAVFLISASAPAAHRYVNNLNGDDNHDGLSEAQAVRTLLRLTAAAEPGDTLVLVNTGTPYEESLSFRNGSGTPAAPIVVEGNGSVICGKSKLGTEVWEPRDAGRYFHAQTKVQRPYLMEGGRMLPEVKSLEKLRPESFFWDKDGVYFLPADGKTPADYDLEGTVIVAGVEVVSSSYIIFRDLICEYVMNDGFNVHGDCQGLYFQNIVGRYNGDEGFSVHEDVQAFVRNGWFHHNGNGITDIQASQTYFQGVLVEHNRGTGVNFVGGNHSLIDSVVRDNEGVQILVNSAHSKSVAMLGLAAKNPLQSGCTIIKNVVASGSDVALRVAQGATLSASNSVFTGSKVCVDIAPSAVCYLSACVVYNGGKTELKCESDKVSLDLNLYFPGRMIWRGQSFGPEEWDAYRETSKQDVCSQREMPQFSEFGWQLQGETAALPDLKIPRGPTRPIQSVGLHPQLKGK